jgi:geranylgeranyl pyrophosphate synthase
MIADILKPIEEELQAVSKLAEKHLLIKGIHIGKLAHLEFSYNEKAIRPALVILSSRIYGLFGDKAVALACVFYFIHMATRVHQSIPEKDSDYTKEDSDLRDGSQFPVLVGDYLYGKYFSLLYKSGMINFLGPLADIICQIHEGGIMESRITGKNPAPESFREVVRKETAELFAGCCVMGAGLAGASKKDQEIMRRFGMNFGMASGLLERGITVRYADEYLKEALTALQDVPERKEKAILEQLINALSEKDNSVRYMLNYQAVSIK